MYKNLKAEMIKQDIKAKDIADLLGIRTETARLKINGKISTNIEDCEKIASLFKENNGLAYLFKNDQQGGINGHDTGTSTGNLFEGSVNEG
ncbi:MAG: hypothetical protein LBQ27_06265 [Clostridiales bacterium]|nr:hypothetical protein [Clostridiales bacterium]